MIYKMNTTYCTSEMDEIVSGNNVGSNRSILATGGYDHTVKLWQAHTGICYWTGQHVDSQVNSLSITPDKQKLASAGYQHIRLYDLNSSNANPVINYEGVSKNVTCVGFQAESKWMYTTGEDAHARIWDLRGKNVQCHRDFRSTSPLNYAILHPNQTELILCDDNGKIHVWNLRNNKSEHQLTPEPEATVQCVAIDPNGSFLASVNNMGRCHIWNLSRESDTLLLEPKDKFVAHTRQALKCKFSPDSSLLATTSADQTVSIWRTEDFSLYQQLKRSGGQRWVWDCAFTNDSKYLITASSDNVARLWHIETGRIEQEYQGHQKAVTALAFADNST